MQRLTLEQHRRDNREYNERDDFLNHLELHQVEGAAVAVEADAVGRHLATIFGKGDNPREQDDADERPMGRYARLLKFQVAVPSQGHEDVAADEQQDGIDCVHVGLFKFRAQSYENKCPVMPRVAFFFCLFLFKACFQ